MASADTGAEVLVDNSAGDVTKENANNEGVKGPSEKAEVEEISTPGKKRRSSSRKSRCDIDIMEEAKAAYGELDSSEGRRLRKRPDPPKVETPPPAKRRSGGRKKVVNEDQDEATADTSNAVENREKTENETGGAGDAKPTTDEKDNSVDQKESCAGPSPTEAAPVPEPDAVLEKPANEVEPNTPEVKTDVESNGDGKSATVEAGSAD